MSFNPPVRDLLFTLTEVVGADSLRETAAFPDADRETLAAVLEAAGTVAAEVIAPLNHPGDRTGATYANGKVTAAPGYAAAYRAFAEGGWTGLAADPAF